MTLEVVRVVGLATVQDLGRRGHMHEGVPPGGALVTSLLVAANRAARNVDDAPAIEVMGRLEVRAVEPIGHYAVKIVFDDGHDTGLFTWRYLHELGRDQAVNWARYLERRTKAGAQPSPRK